MIQAYFTQIKMLVERYAIAPFVLDAAVNFDLRPGDQGYLTGSILFTDYQRFTSVSSWTPVKERSAS